MINVKFPDGSVRQYESGVTGYDIAMSISPRLAADVLAVIRHVQDEVERTSGVRLEEEVRLFGF